MEEKSVMQEIEELLDEGLSKGEIIARGYSESTVRAVIKRRQRKARASNLSALPTRKQTETVLPEWLMPAISELYDGSERDRRIFLAGALTPVLGLRLLAESYKPLVEIWLSQQKLQLETFLALREGGDIGERVATALAPSIDSLRSAVIATAPNPLLAAFSQILQPYLANALEAIFGSFGPKAKAQSASGQPATGGNASESEIKEVFRGY